MTNCQDKYLSLNRRDLALRLCKTTRIVVCDMLQVRFRASILPEVRISWLIVVPLLGMSVDDTFLEDVRYVEDELGRPVVERGSDLERPARSGGADVSEGVSPKGEAS